MSKSFAGGTDLATYARPTGAAMNAASTEFMLIKITNTSDNTWQSYMEFNRVTATENTAGMVRKPSTTVGELAFINTTGASAASVTDIDISDADGWMGLWITRSAAAATGLHKTPVGGSRTTETGTALSHGATWTDVLTIGGAEDPATFLWKVGAYWDGVELTTTQIDGVMTALTSASVAALSPTWLADDSDGFATNLVSPGNGDRTALVGTTTSGDDPSGWVSGLGGAAATIPSLVMAPPIPT